MIHLTILGVPVRILPWHWLTMAFLGGGFSLRSTDMLPLLLLFMIAGFISILCHEMAHALVGRHYGGGSAQVTLSWFGGYTEYYNNRHRTRFGRLAAIAAGCAANMLIVLLCLIFLFIHLRMDIPHFLQSGITFIFYGQYSGFYMAQNNLADSSLILPYGFLGSLMWTSFWWGLLNLMPIYPLDGGKILDHFAKSHKTTYMTGLILGAALGLLGFMYNQIFIGAFMIFFAYENFKLYKNERF